VINLRLFLPFLLLCGCGYRFDGCKDQEKLVTVSIPYIKGDGEGQLNSQLVLALSSSGQFDYAHSNGDLIIQAAIVSDGDSRVGYRFDRNPTTGKLRDNIVGTENRRTVTVQVSIVSAYTNEIVLGPQMISVIADYDYVDSNSIRDLTFETSPGSFQKVLDFSLGQLDSVEGGHDDASAVLYREIAQKIVDGLIVQAVECLPQ
jgi:hypothetical protein